MPSWYIIIYFISCLATYILETTSLKIEAQPVKQAYKGEGVEEEEDLQKKVEWGGGAGGGKGTPAIKAPIGSFLRSLVAAKF